MKNLKLLLFDIDGTLLWTGGAGAKAIDKVFFELYGLEEAFKGIKPDGMIDPAIFREIIHTKNVNVGNIEGAIKLITAKYIDQLRIEMPISEKARIMPGAPELLERLSGETGVQLALVTGNLEQGARIKCDRYDLNKYFSFGAFGSDHENRAELVRIAVKRAEDYLGIKVPLGKNVYVIGDTPKDVNCGKENGTTTVGVATGNFSARQLKDAGADLVFENFKDFEDVALRLLA